MQLTKTTLVDRIEYLPEDNIIQVREVTRILEDDVVISSSYFRYTIDSSTDPASIQDENVCKAYAVYFG